MIFFFYYNFFYIAENLINPLFTDVAFRRDSEGDRSGHNESGGVMLHTLTHTYKEEQSGRKKSLEEQGIKLWKRNQLAFEWNQSAPFYNGVYSLY